MPKKKKNQEILEIKADMKILLEVEQSSGTDGIINRLSLGSYVEEVMPNRCYLIKMPVHKGFNYLLPRDTPIEMYLFAHSRMFSMTVQYLEPVKQDNLLFAKVRKLSGIKYGQRRDCFRLQYAMQILAERKPSDGKKRQTASGKKLNESTAPKELKEQNLPKAVTPPFQGQTLNLSDGGVAFVTNDKFEVGEVLTLTIDLSPADAETLEGIVLRLEKSSVEGYTNSVAVKFRHKCNKQKDRIYKSIVKQQHEIIKKQVEESNKVNVGEYG